MEMLHGNELNDIQANILRRLRTLASGEGLRFAELNNEEVPSDQFSYHLRQLQHNGLIVKDGDGAYTLSVEGKSKAPLIAPHDRKLAVQGYYVATRIILVKEEDGQQKIILQERSVNPQHGKLSTPGGKIVSGTTTDDAARYYMRRQTGLDCDVTLKGMVHFIDEFEGSVVQDRYFFIFLASNPKGELLAEGPRGKNVWMTLDDIKKLPNAVPGLATTINIAFGETLTFEEQRFELEDF